MLGKRVVALDLDVEAPGLHYKLGRAADPDSKPSIAGGAVPYLVATAKGAKNPPPLQEHMAKLAMPEGTEGWLQLMPAGPAPRREYWTALKQLRERLRFDEPSGKGLAALLDLHARIEDELKPDYLLIDSRTGVTELGGLATTALADCVVCLLVPNQESVDGTVAIVEALKISSQQTGRKSIRVVPVVARTTGDLASEGRISEGIKRLVEIGEGRVADDKRNPKPFVLPHDSELGGADKVVGGEKKASAFSPLHKAYLELFQHLFPQARREAEDVLHRLTAVAELREELTERRERRRRRYHFRDAFDPWEDSAIKEGVVLKSDSSKDTRYADLVCRDAKGDALMVVEYIRDGETSEALGFWKGLRDVRCVILLHKAQYRYSQETYCRSDGWENFESADRHEPPRPIEFEIFENPGKRSLEKMLEALHRGNGSLVGEMIAQWRECMTIEEMKGPGRWRPMEARKILDGLAATEKTDVAVSILRHAGRSPFANSDYDDFEGRHGRWMFTAVNGEELFASLLWRLPVEAAFQYLSQAEHPGWSPCLGAHQLLAEQVMGLRYDPVRSAIKDAETLAGLVPDGDTEGDDDERTIHRVYRRLFHRERFRFCAETPPLLLWDEQFREQRSWSGDLEEINDKARTNAKKILGDASRLRTWLRAKFGRQALVTSGLLGQYDPPSGRIELYSTVLEALAPLLGLQPRYLKSVVFIQLSVLAIAHQARDCDGQPGFGFAVASTATPFQRESPSHIALSQYFAFRLIERLQDVSLMGAFEKLSEKQPEPYRRWRSMRRVPVERMRAALLRARLGEAALGLPGVDSD